MKKASNRFSPGVQRCAAEMVLDHGDDRASLWAAPESIAAEIGCTAETLCGAAMARSSRAMGRTPQPDALRPFPSFSDDIDVEGGEMSLLCRLAATVVLVAGLGACAPVAMQPAALAPPPRAAPDRVLVAPATASSSAGISRTLPAGTVLGHRGRIAQGEVWRPLNRTLTAAGRDAHEGWVVISGPNWIGFYLPVERAFSPAARPVPVTTEEHAR